MIINSMRGLGDCIYQRAFLKQIDEPIYLDTPWPELVADLSHVHCVKPVTSLRTQSKNAARHTQWAEVPRGQTVRNIKYGAGGIILGMAQTFGISPGEFDLPPLPSSPESGTYVVVRPATVRSEWRADTRNPDPQYIARAAAEAMRRGYRVISVADLQEGAEWVVGEMPPADVRYHKGELPVEQLLSLVKGAAAVLGGIGWIVPACLAAKTPAWVICGGQGGFNAPELICPEQSTLTFAVPDRFCRCTLKQHNCDKSISDYDSKLTSWFDGLLPVGSGKEPGLAS